MLKVVWYNQVSLAEKSQNLRAVLVAQCGWTETTQWNFVEQPRPGDTVRDTGRLIEKISTGAGMYPLVTVEDGDITVELR